MADGTAAPVIGVLGGSGVEQLAELADARWQKIESPFGTPSDDLLIGNVGDTKVVFLPRHGRGHRIPPSEIDYRANIDALKRAGVTDLLSISACGSLREDLPPGSFILVDQYIDRAAGRDGSFFSTGCVAHVSMARPVCARLVSEIETVAGATGEAVRSGGSYLVMEGPQFSTRAESELYRSWGCDVIGMSNMPEAKLAREAEICYASVAMVTDYDCWHDDHADVSVADIIAVLTRNAERARTLVAEFARSRDSRPVPCPEGCDRALDTAIITAPEARDPAALKRLEAVAGRVLGSAGSDS
jgi:5'-methylthioadenosine phosphorylase